jgi:hypothetical protein
VDHFENWFPVQLAAMVACELQALFIIGF